MTTIAAAALDAVYDKAAAGRRLSVEEGVALLEEGDLLTLARSPRRRAGARTPAASSPTSSTATSTTATCA